MSWIASIVGWFMAAMAIAVFMGGLGAMWGASKRDMEAGGFGMGRFRGERQYALFGPGGAIESAAAMLSACLFGSIAFACWLMNGTSEAAVVTSLVAGFVWGIAMMRDEARKK
jgi:hypothetical protein